MAVERAILNELGFKTRNEALDFLKRLWRQEIARCPICGSDLELLHTKAKKNNCDWQCRKCNKTYKTIYLLDEINAHMPE